MKRKGNRIEINCMAYLVCVAVEVIHWATIATTTTTTIQEDEKSNRISICKLKSIWRRSRLASYYTTTAAAAGRECFAGVEQGENTNAI